MPNLSCATCGGENYYKDAGYFFCSECHSRAPDALEHEFEQLDGTITSPIKSTKVRSSNSSKAPESEQITSWECYNYILLGLVNELIDLGASENLKLVVQTIWFNYLHKIEVIHKDTNKPPNLPAFNNKHDAKVIFGRHKKKKTCNKRKRRISCSSSGSVTEADSIISRKEQNRLKRTMTKAAYESQLSEVTQQSASILSTASLASLQSNNCDQRKGRFLKFSTAAKAELLTHMSRAHLREHAEDVNVSLTCHSLTYKELSCPYKKGPSVMKQTNLYSILYLGLLVNKDSIHLGDLLRFMNEGSLSYNYYQHFFPEDIDSQTSFLNTFKVTKIHKHETYRTSAGKMAEFLALSGDIPTPNIVRLVERYCGELNLPKEVFSMCKSFIAHTQPELKVCGGVIPNYEARAMCVIVFALKLLYGLDGVTEVHLSAFATLINGHVACSYDGEPEMFSFMNWLQTLLYRRHILAMHHFPTGFNAKYCPLQNYIEYINAYHARHDIQRQEDLDYDNIERVVFNGVGYEQGGLQSKFGSSMTPLSDNLRILYESGALDGKQYKLTVLLADYDPASITFLKQPRKYCAEDTAILSRGANEDIKLVPIHTFHSPTRLQSGDEVTCKLSNARVSPRMTHDEDGADGPSAGAVVDFFDRLHAGKLGESMSRSFNEFGPAVKGYAQHYRPDKRYWLRLGADIANMGVEAFDDFWASFPYHFRLVLTECANITGQTVKDILLEFNLLDTYVCYGHLFGGDRNGKAWRRKNRHLGTTLMRLARSAAVRW